MAEKQQNPTPEEQKTAAAQAEAAPEKGSSTGKKKADKKHGKAAHNPDMAAQIASAESKAAEAEKQVAELKDTLVRTAAEYENYRKRSQKEQESAFGHGISHAACELLPVIDTLEAAAHAETADEEYKKGVLLTLDKCTEVFHKLGIHEVEALGQPFDPELHNAVMQDPVEGAQSGTVTKVLQKGYSLNGRVIRHAMVAVAP